MKGHSCDNCERMLKDEDYLEHGSWSYTCHHCELTYVHGSRTADEQVEMFNGSHKENKMEERENTIEFVYDTNESLSGLIAKLETKLDELLERFSSDSFGTLKVTLEFYPEGEENV